MLLLLVILHKAHNPALLLESICPFYVILFLSPLFKCVISAEIACKVYNKMDSIIHCRPIEQVMCMWNWSNSSNSFTKPLCWFGSPYQPQHKRMRLVQLLSCNRIAKTTTIVQKKIQILWQVQALDWEALTQLLHHHFIWVLVAGIMATMEGWSPSKSYWICPFSSAVTVQPDETIWGLPISTWKMSFWLPYANRCKLRRAQSIVSHWALGLLASKWWPLQENCHEQPLGCPHQGWQFHQDPPIFSKC